MAFQQKSLLSQENVLDIANTYEATKQALRTIPNGDLREIAEENIKILENKEKSKATWKRFPKCGNRYDLRPNQKTKYFECKKLGHSLRCCRSNNFNEIELFKYSQY